MKRDLYALHDVEPTLAFPVTPESAPKWNEKGYGIFWTVNEFAGRRKGSNLKRLNSWYVEIDEGSKPHQLSLVEASPVAPNLIIESKRGFQLYWNCRDATLEAYPVILERLRHFFTADNRAKDVARILRAPGYKHMKDPNDPYHISVVWELDGTYSERLMLWNFPVLEEEEDETTPIAVRYNAQSDDFWEKVYSLDCEDALRRLSGTHYVNGEIYSFRPSGQGKLNIWVNGKSSSCWIDSNKRIGSSTQGGPSIYQWLKWYGKSNSEVYRIIKELFPEVTR